MILAIERIQTILREILDDHPAGVSEYDLLKILTERNLFNENYLNNTLGLFQRHFLLFHCLYLLRNKLRASKQGNMTIHCLCIQIMPYSNTLSDYPATIDPLADYYLDFDNLTSTSESDVIRLLDNFWRKFTGNEQHDEALAVMQLTSPCSYPVIRQQYRRLAMQWHPDRGGEPSQFHRLEWAMGILRTLYS